jgi:putative SOS response-associated peptidase YedK
MCNEYARLIDLENLALEMRRLQLPEFEWDANQIPNDLEGKESVRIRDTAPILRLKGDRLSGEMTTWAWKGPQGRPVFNFVSEGRNFSSSDRVLVPATGFYE